MLYEKKTRYCCYEHHLFLGISMKPTTPPFPQIRVLQYDPDQERLLSMAVYQHAPEIWCIAPSAASEEHLITVWSKGKHCSSSSPHMEEQT